MSMNLAGAVAGQRRNKGYSVRRTARMAAALLAVSLPVCFGQGPPREQRPQVETSPAVVSDDTFHAANPPELVAEIERAIRDLGHPDFAVRQLSSKRLFQIGLRASAQLRDAYRATSDLEVRLRVEAVVYRAYLDEHLTAKNGFLGVEIRLAPAGVPSKLIPPGGVGFLISRVVAGSAADRAGLQRGDIAIKLDGQPIKGGRNAFRDAIRKRHRGNVLGITVLRGGNVYKPYEFEVILDGRPIDQFGFDLAPERAAADRGFRRWWAEHFSKTDPEPDTPNKP